MAKREKILIAVTVIAAVFMAYTMLFKADDKEKAVATGKKAEQVSDETFIKRQAALLESMKKTETQLMIIQKAQSKWLSDPFADAQLMAKIQGGDKKDQAVAQASAIPDAQVLYSGYIQIGTRLLAIVNGLEYEKGDIIKGTDYRLYAATPGTITLRSSNARIKRVNLIDNLSSKAKREE